MSLKEIESVAREQDKSLGISSKVQTGLSKRNIRRQYDDLMKEAGHLLLTGKIKCSKCGTPFQMDESLASNPTMNSHKNLELKTLKLSKKGGGSKKTGESGLASPGNRFQMDSDKGRTGEPGLASPGNRFQMDSDKGRTGEPGLASPPGNRFNMDSDKGRTGEPGLASPGNRFQMDSDKRPTGEPGLASPGNRFQMDSDKRPTGEPGLSSPPGSKVSFQVYSDKGRTGEPGLTSPGNRFQMDSDKGRTGEPGLTSPGNRFHMDSDKRPTGEPGLTYPGNRFQMDTDKGRAGEPGLASPHLLARTRRLALTPPAPRSKNMSGFTSPFGLKSSFLKNKDSIDIYKDEEPVKITKSSTDEILSHQIVKEARSNTQDERHSFAHATFTSKAQETTYSTFTSTVTSSTPLAYDQRDSGNNFKCSEISMKWSAPSRGSMDAELCEDEDSLLIPRFRRSNLLSDLDLYEQDIGLRSENDYFLLKRRVSGRSSVYPTKLLNTISEEGSSEQNSESHLNTRLQPPHSLSILSSDKTPSFEESNLMRLSEQRKTIPRLSSPKPKLSQPPSNIDKENLRPGQLGFPSGTGLTRTNQAVPIRTSAQKKPLLSILDQENISTNENSTQDHSNNKPAPSAAVKPFVGHNKSAHTPNKENMRKTDKNTPESVTLFVQNKLNTSYKLSCDLNNRESTLIQSPKISDISFVQVKKVSIKSIGMELFGIDTPRSNRKYGRPGPLGVSSQMVQEIERLRESKNKSLVKKSQMKDSDGLNTLCQSSKSTKDAHSSFEQDDKLKEIKGRGRRLKSQIDDSVSKSCLNKPLKMSKFDQEKYSSIEADTAVKPKETKSRGRTLKSQTKEKDSVNNVIVKEKIESEELVFANEHGTPSIPVEEDVRPEKRLHGTANADLSMRISTFPTENEDVSTCNPGLPRRSCRLKLKSLRGDKPAAPSRASVTLEERKSIKKRTFSTTRSKKRDSSHISTILAPSKFDPFNHKAVEGLLKELGFPKPHHKDNYFVLNTNLPIQGVRTMKINEKCFRVVKELCPDSSSSSKVVKAVSPGGDPVALKIVKPSSSWEFYILKELQTRNQDNLTYAFVDVRAAFIYKNGSILETPYAKFGTLIDVINTFEKIAGGGALDPGVVLHFSQELTGIVEHLHRCQVIHADLTADNIVLCDLPDPEEAKPCLRLIDFDRSIDMSLFPSDCQFQVPPFKKEHTTILTREKKPWSYQIDLEGLASVFYLLLSSKPLEVEKRNSVWKPRKTLPRL